MNREDGIQALNSAIEQLNRAHQFLHEHEGEQGNLSGPVCFIIGGLTDMLYGLVEVLEDSLPKPTDATVATAVTTDTADPLFDFPAPVLEDHTNAPHRPSTPLVPEEWGNPV